MRCPWLSLILVVSVLVSVFSCITPSGEFYGIVGTFSNEQGSHKDLIALLKSSASGSASSDASVMRGIRRTSSSAPPSMQAGSVMNYSKKYAVSIGIDDYRYWPKLGNARNDAFAMEQLLKSLGYTIFHLYDRQATKDNIQSMLVDIIGSKADINDSVVIFYAGHGQTLDLDNGQSLGYIVPVEGKTTEYGTMISMTNLLDWSRVIKAREMLFIMDSCYSGTGKLSDISLKETSSGECKSRQIITAGQKDQQVFDSTEKGVRHSVFTNLLIEAIADRAADSDNDGLVAGSELGSFLKQKVSDSTSGLQVPDYGDLPGHTCGDYMFYPMQTREIEESDLYCDLSPEFISFEFYNRIDTTSEIQTIIFNPVYSSHIAVATSTEIIVWDTDLDEEVFRSAANPADIAFSPNGECIATVDYGGKISFYDILTGKIVFSTDSPISKIYSLDFSPNAGKLAIGGIDKAIVWDIMANLPQPVVCDHKGNISSVHFTSNSGLFTVSDEMTSKLWNLNTQQEMKRIDESSDMNELISTAFSADGTLMALGVKQVNLDLMRNSRTDLEFVRIRDTDTGDDIWTFEAHGQAISSLAFHPNKHYFASASLDKDIRFWDGRDRKQFKVIPNDSPVKEVCFSSNGCLFASATANRVTVWKLTEDRSFR
ncbi:MAG: caspase family protein [Deltaproteobacteria bacterium]|nr:caspase family protein [Deltaproteobacteria bacterium]